MEQIHIVTNIIKDKNDIEIDVEIDNNISINEIIDNSINLIGLKDEINLDLKDEINLDLKDEINLDLKDEINLDLKDKINLDLNKADTIIELPVKKKKGRKSKKTKELELEQEKPKEPVLRFPKLTEKIFDVLKIDGIEYFYDTDFNLLLDINVIPVGFKYEKKFVFYSDTINSINQIKKDDIELKCLLGNFIPLDI